MNAITPIKIAILGASGRMGQMLLRQIAQDLAHYQLVGATTHQQHALLGKTIAELLQLSPTEIKKLSGNNGTGAMIGKDFFTQTLIADPAKAVVMADLVIDFSIKTLIPEHAGLAAVASAAYLTGVTGLAEPEYLALAKAARHVPVMLAANTAVSVLLLQKATANLIKQLYDTGADYTISISETHHIHKKDKPSGTALAFGKTITDLVPNQSIHYASMRTGEVIGEHEIKLTGKYDSITLKHVAHHRQLFAAGALFAGAWLIQQPPKFYQIADLLKS